MKENLSMLLSRYKVTFMSMLVSLTMLVAFAHVSPVVAVSGWDATGSMTTSRYSHTATLLANGKVLVTGGYDESPAPQASAEVYDPLSGSWSATGSMTTIRSVHTATLMANGKVLVAGGSDASFRLASAEVYDPLSGTWSATAPMTTPRVQYTATLLANGTVLVVGGIADSGFLASAEVYDPLSGTWSPTGSMTVSREGHTATLLANGTVLVTGGYSDSGPQASAEVYDPLSGSWSATGSMSTGHAYHTATLLANGTVLVAGGVDDIGGLVRAELYGVIPDNPVPTLTSLDPNSAVAGSGNFILTLNGTNFVSSSVVRWNGADRPTTYISSTQLSVIISPADITTQGSASVTAFNPSPGGGVSNALSFTILPPNQPSVAIDIKPNSPHNRINLQSWGKLPVAILSSATFDASQVNPRSVTLAGAPVIIKPNGKPFAQLKDVNHDKRLDLVVRVRIQDLQLTEASTEGILIGMTFGGQAIEGKDKVSIVPAHGPELKAPRSGSIQTKGTFKLKWDLNDEEEEATTCFLVQIDNQSDFSSPEQSSVVVRSLSYTTAPLTNGVYYWRVAVSDCASTVITPWSETWSFIVRVR
jgi:Kelch motif